MKKEAVSGKDTAFLVQGKIGKISLYAKETRVLDGRVTEYAVEKTAVKKPKFSGELRLIQNCSLLEFSPQRVSGCECAGIAQQQGIWGQQCGRNQRNAARQREGQRI